MRSILLSLCILAGCGGGSDNPVNSAQATQPQKVIFGVGDSIMAGYIPGDGVSERLAQDESFIHGLKSVGKVISSPVGGAPTRDALSNQTAWLGTPYDSSTPPVKPDVVVILLGTNDAVMGVDPAVSIENVRAIADKWPTAKLVLMSPPTWTPPYDPWMADYTRRLQKLANERGAVFIDVFTLSLSRPDWQCTPSNHHPCANAHREWAQLILKAL